MAESERNDPTVPPLVRSKKTKTKPLKREVVRHFKPSAPRRLQKEYGTRKHIVAGYEGGIKMKRQTGGGQDKHPYASGFGKLSKLLGINELYNLGQREEFKKEKQSFEKFMRKRRHIPKLPDPDKKKYQLEKKEARRRMLGVAGTRLTQRGQ